ncbi:hypothetical protein BT96DRAFT_1029718 [Gymnopus androsaceus JB14]|uniref:Uncharacterized protein n=1 Tax=Gymnopus androsaceus JB14 TaxID=1447944 RepID=A0A6A4IQR1_9AGAR|nr:hypothetical protein BT96DRAFT_1029718 [Gymnopus androsaceus JB14]
MFSADFLVQALLATNQERAYVRPHSTPCYQQSQPKKNLITSQTSTDVTYEAMTFTTTVSTATSGTLVIINNSQNVTVSMDISSSSASLCQTNAECIVEDFGYELPNWGTVTFTDASAKTLSSTQLFSPDFEEDEVMTGSLMETLSPLNMRLRSADFKQSLVDSSQWLVNGAELEMKTEREGWVHDDDG